MVEYEGVSPWPPAHEVLLTPDVGGGGVQDPPLTPLEAGTALYPSSENHLVHAGQPVGLGVSERSLEQMLQSRAQSAVSAVHNHGQVLGDDGGLGAALKLKKQDELLQDLSDRSSMLLRAEKDLRRFRKGFD